MTAEAVGETVAAVATRSMEGKTLLVATLEAMEVVVVMAVTAKATTAKPLTTMVTRIIIVAGTTVVKVTTGEQDTVVILITTSDQNSVSRLLTLANPSPHLLTLPSKAATKEPLPHPTSDHRLLLRRLRTQCM